MVFDWSVPRPTGRELRQTGWNNRDDSLVLYTYKNAFASDNKPLGAIKGHEVDITLNIDRPYPPVLRRPAYQASPRAREALEKHIQELSQLGVLRKVGHNKDV
ncbi:hypothetical protein O181_089537 [Austropuccinia psidii MF-1]|uniref:Uncharacterized protein n=1 Tax=Austropuccinia psidii MF-1 TaxID=1389203 RepID=A0A9Q3ITM5_9BASI|nr:hypothetical protein [Austropuccinia psidii MF-1]